MYSVTNTLFFRMEEKATYQCMECPKKITHKGTLHRLFLKLFIILTNIDTLLCTPGEKSDIQREQAAQACEEFGKFFPVNFYRSLTRKMHVISFVAPEQIRNDGDFYFQVCIYCSATHISDFVKHFAVYDGNEPQPRLRCTGTISTVRYKHIPTCSPTTDGDRYTLI